MATSTHIMFDNPNAVKKNFLRCGFPFYTITDSKNNILWINDSEKDIDAAAETLCEDLEMIRDYNTATYTINHFKKVPAAGLKKTTEPDCISTFKKGYSEEQRMNYNIGRNDSSMAILDELRSMKNEVQELKLKIDIEEGEGEDEEELKQKMEPASFLGSLIGNPAVQTTITNFLTNLLANLTTPSIQKNMPQTLAGTETETINDILQRLESKGVTAMDLQKLSNLPDSQITMLLGMLRNM